MDTDIDVKVQSYMQLGNVPKGTYLRVGRARMTHLTSSCSRGWRRHFKEKERFIAAADVAVV